MQEEYHGEGDGIGYKRLYNWNTLTANAWLPSLSELAGTTGNPADWSGCCFSAMQGLNVSVNYWTDEKGGTQFAYFTQYNASGGGEKIWEICGRKKTWLRSSSAYVSDGAWFANLAASRFDWALATDSAAVHPAGVDFRVSFLLYPPKVKRKDREKLGTKAVKEEFHYEEGKGFQQLYGWGTIYPSVWLPSLSELVGIDPDNYYEPSGVYLSAMQGLNTSTGYSVDSQGGNQFAYFKQYNVSGGGEVIWATCKQEQPWLRSCVMNISNIVWRITSAQRMDTPSPTASHAVHPARDKKISSLYFRQVRFIMKSGFYSNSLIWRVF